MTKAQADINRKLRILKHGVESRNIAKTCRYFGISREIFYQWKRTYAEKGESGLINSKPCPENPKLRVPAPIAEKILYLRQIYHLGAMRISWFLEQRPSIIKDRVLELGKRLTHISLRSAREHRWSPGARIGGNSVVG